MLLLTAVDFTFHGILAAAIVAVAVWFAARLWRVLRRRGPAERSVSEMQTRRSICPRCYTVPCRCADAASAAAQRLGLIKTTQTETGAKLK